MKIENCHNLTNSRKEINIEKINENQKSFHRSFNKRDRKYFNELTPFYTRNKFDDRYSTYHKQNTHYEDRGNDKRNI